MLQRLAVAISLALALFLSPSGSGKLSLIQPPPVMLSEHFEEAVELWRNELAKQPEFREWKEADWRKEPLGPGMHGWIVVFSRNQQEIGYLIVSAKPEGGFVLTEYGTWPIVPGEDTVFPALFEYPIQLTDDLVISSETTLALEKNVILPYTDPYANISWMFDEEIAMKDLEDLLELVTQPLPITYIREIDEPEALFAYAVTGYHRWPEGSPYIRLEFEGLRYVPAAALLHSGRFYHAKVDRYARCPLLHTHDDEDA